MTSFQYLVILKTYRPVEDGTGLIRAELKEVEQQEITRFTDTACILRGKLGFGRSDFIIHDTSNEFQLIIVPISDDHLHDFILSLV